MKTLLIDGEWCLKKNFHKRKDMQSFGDKCGGSFGFIDSLRAVINKILPDRVIVMWDGSRSGKFRYEIYNPYKANRKKLWEQEEKIISLGKENDPESRQKYELVLQKLKVKNYLEDLFVRQVEVEFIEADDLIAGYILESDIPNEEIIIYSRDKDFRQLISNTVSILTPDSFKIVTLSNFKSIYGYTIENELLFKCFEGDSSDGIPGVKGITINTLEKYFHDIRNKKYLLKELIQGAEDLNNSRKKRLKTLDAIINSSSVMYRNAKLMNLKAPFLNDEAIKEIKCVIRGTLSEEDRSIKKAIEAFYKDGYNELVFNGDVNLFFSNFYHLKSKELYFSNNN